MARKFHGTDRVVVSSATELDNLSTFTIIAWVWPSGILNRPIFDRLFWKSPTGQDAGKQFFSDGEGGIDLFVKRDTGNADYAAFLPWFNRWTYIATTFDADNGAHIYFGSRQVPVYEAAWWWREPGTGTVTDDTDDIWIGNRESTAGGGANRAYNGLIERVQYFNTALSFAEIQAQQFTPRNISECVLWLEIGNEIDKSGNNNDGTVTGTTLITSPSLVPESNFVGFGGETFFRTFTGVLTSAGAQNPIEQVQVALPTSDVDLGPWSGSYTDIDDPVGTPDFTDFVATAVAGEAQFGLSSISDPADNVRHRIFYSFDVQAGTHNLTFRLREGATQRASWTRNSVTGPIVQGMYELTTGEADTIGNYGALRVTVEKT